MTDAGWTSEQPKEPGIYWYRDEHTSPMLIRVNWRMEVDRFGMDCLTPIARFQGFFLGPISPDTYHQGRVAGREEVIESFKKHHDECHDFRHCECAGGFWYQHIGKPWMDDKQQAQGGQP